MTNPTEIDIYRRFLNKNGRILVIGPYGDYKNDPTIAILLKLVNVENIVVIDRAGRGININQGCYGDIFKTRKSISQLHPNPLKYVMSDGLRISFREGTFDAIIDRATHGFIFEKHPKIEDLVSQYNRVLKPGGRILFLCLQSRPTTGLLIKTLEEFNFKLEHGGLKILHEIQIGEDVLKPFYTPVYFIVALKK